jgi:hypothetical protein
LYYSDVDLKINNVDLFLFAWVPWMNDKAIHVWGKDIFKCIAAFLKTSLQRGF